MHTQHLQVDRDSLDGEAGRREAEVKSSSWITEAFYLPDPERSIRSRALHGGGTRRSRARRGEIFKRAPAIAPSGSRVNADGAQGRARRPGSDIPTGRSGRGDQIEILGISARYQRYDGGIGIRGL